MFNLLSQIVHALWGSLFLLQSNAIVTYSTFQSNCRIWIIKIWRHLHVAQAEPDFMFKAPLVLLGTNLLKQFLKLLTSCNPKWELTLPAGLFWGKICRLARKLSHPPCPQTTENQPVSTDLQCQRWSATQSLHIVVMVPEQQCSTERTSFRQRSDFEVLAFNSCSKALIL